MSDVTRDGAFSKGAIVANHYRVDSKVGEGAFGEVWQATVLSTGQRVALKRLHTMVAADGEMFKRFRREAYFLSRVNSDYVAKVLNFLPDPNHGMVLVLEFIEGASLSDILNAQLLGVELAIDIGIDMLYGLADLHAARIIHRDLKPANVIMRPLPSGDCQAVICDFGMSRLSSRSGRAMTPTGKWNTQSSSSVRSMSLMTSLTPSGVTLGSLQYMSPEQILSSRDVTERTDIYAVGAILYRAVAGEHPFEESNGPRSIARSKLMQEAPRLETGRKDPVALAFEEAVGRALRRKPKDRYESAEAMLKDFLKLHEIAMEAVRLEGDTMPRLDARAFLKPRPSDEEERSLEADRASTPPPAHPAVVPPALVAQAAMTLKVNPFEASTKGPSPVAAQNNATSNAAASAHRRTDPMPRVDLEPPEPPTRPSIPPPVTRASLHDVSTAAPAPAPRADARTTSSSTHPVAASDPSSPPPAPSAERKSRVSPALFAVAIATVFVVGFGAGRLFPTATSTADDSAKPAAPSAPTAPVVADAPLPAATPSLVAPASAAPTVDAAASATSSGATPAVTHASSATVAPSSTASTAPSVAPTALPSAREPATATPKPSAAPQVAPSPKPPAPKPAAQSSDPYG